MLPFCDRMEELDALTNWVEHTPRLGVLHGRRRLGKTRLLRHWIDRVDACYILATEGTAASQRAAFAEDLETIVPGFGEPEYPDWRSLFRSLVTQWPKDRRRCVLIVDELPYWVKTSPEVPSLLQGIVDDPDAEHLPLIVCGSSQRMMQGLVMDASAPLYGRAQLVLRLKPLPVKEIVNAFHVEEPAEVVETYAAWGGVPRYWELASPGSRKLWETLVSLVLSPSGVLHEEGTRVLRDESAALLERSICQAIGRGARRPSELASRLGVPSTTLGKPLRHLTELGLVRRDAPYDLSRGRPKEGTRSSQYVLIDPFLGMWYRCVNPYRSGLELGSNAAVFHAREAWVQHVAEVWEELVRMHWHDMRFEDFEWEAAGRYWEGRKRNGLEWDVVSVTPDRGRVMLGECKWRKTVSERSLSRMVGEIRARPLPGAAQGKRVHRVLFLPSAAGLPSEHEGVRLVDASDLLS